VNIIFFIYLLLQFDLAGNLPQLGRNVNAKTQFTQIPHEKKFVAEVACLPARATWFTLVNLSSETPLLFRVGDFYTIHRNSS